ncbi:MULTISPECIES: sigma-70 family RNA polymerase sigma factor [unclassified Neisseria]|uniref:sigma-70 family RNA polymerase sigma factor n=1 Tax=unclassified Neisseria TaxID=2623750 RepID=UPI002666FE24|nr:MULTISPECIES: sigma-70 family RNA polymerase sigma factor [unclassified Neisseria]MDO1510764.1 sigma-70 family RNA polymerase sigma factor [Neisseria sp. MVDL19-042950]MDO1517053.1 sigma-70 family RNA polymerase sigma factor [Neisseria sp. MVDL18-041461]MDO1564416.1 sigma-70 family RNA polymerase sigma factor [Neisseria sp. MVDL20-010259]
MENFKKLLTSIQPDILRFARIQLRDDHLAEDIVQETLAAAIDKYGQFRGDAGLKTWVMTILKNKITDYFRSKKNIVSIEGLQEENAAIDSAYNECFDETGHWFASASPQQWREAPEEFTRQQDFFRTLENCMQGLPEDTAQIFYLREIMGLEITEICSRFDISKDNCYVILHRARNGLRNCLQHRWFDLNE